MISVFLIAAAFAVAGVIQCFRARTEFWLGVGWSLLLSAFLLAIAAVAKLCGVAE